MATLKFKGPFHFEHLKDLIADGSSNINNHGVYIWGFVMSLNECYRNGLVIEDFTEKKITPYVNSTNGVALPNDSIFIPYYVGKVESESIAKRLSEHREVRNNKNSRKYTRLSIDYYSCFFRDPFFKPNTGNSNGKRCKEIYNLIWPNNGQNTNKVVYQNCNVILNKLYGLNILKKLKKNLTEDYDYPITDYKMIPDTLRELVYCKNNFWFCYAELDENGEIELQEYRKTLKKGSRSEFLKDHEAQTFYSLKGKTISETKNFADVHAIHDIIPEKSCEDIFKMYKSKAYISNQFKGYMKHFNQLSAQLKDSKLTVKYSEANGCELACIWEDKSDAESLLVINRIKVNGDEIIKHSEKDNNIRETLMRDFLNPKNDDDNQTILKQNLNDIVNRTYKELDKFIEKRRGFITGEKFGF